MKPQNYSHNESVNSNLENIFALKMRNMKTDYQYRIITNIKRLREKAGYSQADIAKVLGISTGQLGNIESYKQSHKYTLSQIIKICDTLKISIDKIFFYDDINQNITHRMLIDKIIEYQNNK